MTYEPQTSHTGRKHGVPTVSRVCADRTLIELVYDAAMARMGL